MDENKDDYLDEYRKTLIAAEQKAQEDFDKTVIALSGGALGISFAFVKDIVGPQPWEQSWALLVAWTAWATSVACVLASYYFSQQSLRRAIHQVDTEEIYDQVPGGLYSKITNILNALGGILFLVGVICVIFFAAKNF